MSKKPHNFLYRAFWLLLVATLLAVGGSYWLSRQTFFATWQVKLFNPLGDLLPTEVIASAESDSITEEPLDKLPTLPEEELPLQEEPLDTLPPTEVADSLSVRKAPVTSGGFSDYTASGDAVERIRMGLASGRYYIAMLGDSFIEGDIFVGPLRNALQSRYGGRGVGYVALTSKTARFRQSVQHRFGGNWKSSDLAHQRRGVRYTITEQVDAAAQGCHVTYKMPTSPSNLARVDYATLLYQADSAVLLSCQINDAQRDTITLPGKRGTLHRHTFRIPEGIHSLALRVEGDNAQSDSLLMHGIFLDGEEGVSVDNLSLRGSSGIQLRQISRALTQQMHSLRPYQLIILQYGINVIDPQQPNDKYHWYYRRMEAALKHLQALYPKAIIVICSVSDRASRLDDGSIQTLPAVGYIWEHQRGLAQRYGCLFWDTLGAMQEAGGIVGFVQRGQAAKDYTHLNFAGGATLAKAFVRDLLERTPTLPQESAQGTSRKATETKQDEKHLAESEQERQPERSAE